MRTLYRLLALGGIALIAACNDSSGPAAATSSTSDFSRQISFTDLNNTLQGLPASGAARVELGLSATGFVAREVSVENARQVNAPEKARSWISDLTVSGTNGTLTLAPGFQVTFTGSTTFEADDASLTLQQFVDRVNAALAQTPKVMLAIEAERTPDNPLVLGPTDAFPADKIELRGNVGHPKLKLNVTQANLVAANTGVCTEAKLGVTPLGCVEVLGMTLGITHESDLHEMRPGIEKAEFEGAVDCSKPIDANLDPDGSFFLTNGTQVIVDAHTQIEAEREEGESHLSLADVVTACSAAQPAQIRAEGEGVPQSGGGGTATIRATEVRFETEQEEQEQEQAEVEFRGVIQAVDVQAGTITIADHKISVDQNTRIERRDQAIGLADLHTGDMVEVRATLESDGTILAKEIKVES